MNKKLSTVTDPKSEQEITAMVFRKELENLDQLLRFKAGRTGGISIFNEGQIQELRTLISQMAFWFSVYDNNFDKENFLKACGVGV